MAEAKKPRTRRKAKPKESQDTGFIDWIKPSGISIRTNSSPGTVEYAESLGWKRA